jgi:4-hydroxy-4-methyl-2-oxoglutarate aldolase
VTPPDELARRLAACYTGAVFDAMRERGLRPGALPSAIQLIDHGRRAAGPVFTVAGSRKPAVSVHHCLFSWTRFF